LLHGKCPRCRKGEIFTYPASRLSKFNVMNSTCPNCGVMFQPEPGFYQGAMYVSYAFAIVFIVTISIVFYVAGDPSEPSSWRHSITGTRALYTFTCLAASNLILHGRSRVFLTFGIASLPTKVA
jgi:uncharacterized protein (DUF983 family)